MALQLPAHCTCVDLVHIQRVNPSRIAFSIELMHSFAFSSAILICSQEYDKLKLLVDSNAAIIHWFVTVAMQHHV